MAEKGRSENALTKDEVHKCKTCHFKCTDVQSYNEHLKSKDHKKQIMKEIYGAKYLEAKANLDNTPINANLSVKKPAVPELVDKDSINVESSDEEDDVYTCEICRKICTGFLSYQMHLKGKKHQKCVHKAKLLKKLMESNLMPKTSQDKPPEEQSLLDRIMYKAEYASQDIKCEICQKNCSGPESYRQHCQSSAHQKKVAVKDLMDEMTSEEGNQLPESPFARCNICQKNFSGLLPYQQHMDGIQHLKQVRRMEELSKIKDLIVNDKEDSKKFKCKECGKSFSGPVPFQTHLQSTVHAKIKKKASQMKHLMESYPELVKVSAHIHDSEDSDNSEPEGFLLACDVCNLVCSGPEAARDHFESAKHQKAVKRRLNLRSF